MLLSEFTLNNYIENMSAGCNTYSVSAPSQAYLSSYGLVRANSWKVYQYTSIAHHQGEYKTYKHQDL
jgi:hypothetical protein